MGKIRDRLKREIDAVCDGPWKEYIDPAVFTPEFKIWLYREYENKHITPEWDDIFRVFKEMKPEDVRVILLGQDPYPGEGMAIGRAFGYLSYKQPPASFHNIQKELKRCYGSKLKDTELNGWQKQGVLLLNTVLTTEVGLAGTHINKGWEKITTGILQKLAEKKKNENNKLIFMLLGARAKNAIIATKVSPLDHYFLFAPHPSPLARGFVGSGIFEQVNILLEYSRQASINWIL